MHLCHAGSHTRHTHATLWPQFVGVFDGHGKEGERVSLYLRQHLPLGVIGADVLDTDAPTGLTESFEALNASLCRDVDIKLKVSGSTCTTALIVGTRLWCANVGDSRTVLATSANASDGFDVGCIGTGLSNDHKPEA